MTEGDAATRTADQAWDVFVLAMLAPMASFPPVRLSPKLSQQDLGGVSGLAIPRGPGEFLAAVIVPEEVGPPVLLTNHRIIWFDRVASAPGSKLPSYAGRAATYEDIDGPIPVAGADRPGVDLGQGRVVPLPAIAPGLAAALATAAGAIARAARTGEAEAVPADLAGRILRALPAIRQVDAGLRNLAEERTRFRRDLFASAPTAYATPTLLALCVIVYALATASGVDAMFPTDPTSLLPWGANDAIRVVLKGEWWRLPASVFLHGGGIHLAVNMMALLALGPLVERLYGSLRFTALYMAAGVGGAIASMATPPARVGVGASGAIFGIIGGLLAFLVLHRRSIPPKVLATLRSQTLTMIVLNVAIGAMVPVIDQAAHLGGLATGFLAGLLLVPAWPRERPDFSDRLRSAALVAATALIVVAAGAGVVRWRAETITPRDLLRDYVAQVRPLRLRLSESLAAQRQIAEWLEAPDAGKADADRKIRAKLTELEEGSRENLAAIGRVWTPSPKLGEAVRVLAEAQREGDAGVRAVARYIDTRDPRWLEGEDGFIAKAVVAHRLEAELRAAEVDYARANGLVDLVADDTEGEG